MKAKTKKSVKIMLSDKVADALTLKPRVDIEDDQVFGTKPQTVSRADLGSSDSEDEAAISDFRKRNVNLLSEVSKKYEGQVITRKDLSKFSDDSDESGDESDYDKTSQDDKDGTPEEKITDDELPKAPDTDSDNSSDGESDDYSITKFQTKTQLDDDVSDDDDEDEDEGYDISQLEEPLVEDFQHVKKQNISEEAKKGNCVRNQLLVWEGLLEMRIHLQRCVNSANQMPMPETYNELKNSNEFVEESNNTKLNVATVLDKLLTLQNILFKNYPETKTLTTNKRSTATSKVEQKQESDEEIPSDTEDEEIPSDTEEDESPVSKNTNESKKSNAPANLPKKRKLDDYEKEISISHKAFKPFRDASIQKWNEKTRLATASNIKNAPTNTVLQQISYILSDRDKLIRRTQLKRTEYDIVGYSKAVNNENDSENVTKNRKDDDEYIPEIFDDNDFYHQLLRELIECKSADISDPVQLSRQWIALQQMRSKMKRKVDTKATKGRKIKYVVHNQLVNYMAPEKCLTWTEESTNELYNSLFGKMFEHNNTGLGGDVGNIFKLK